MWFGELDRLMGVDQFGSRNRVFVGVGVTVSCKLGVEITGKGVEVGVKIGVVREVQAVDNRIATSAQGTMTRPRFRPSLLRRRLRSSWRTAKPCL